MSKVDWRAAYSAMRNDIPSEAVVLQCRASPPSDIVAQSPLPDPFHLALGPVWRGGRHLFRLGKGPAGDLRQPSEGQEGGRPLHRRGGGGGDAAEQEADGLALRERHSPLGGQFAPMRSAAVSRHQTNWQAHKHPTGVWGLRTVGWGHISIRDIRWFDLVFCSLLARCRVDQRFSHTMLMRLLFGGRHF